MSDGGHLGGALQRSGQIRLPPLTLLLAEETPQGRLYEKAAEEDEGATLSSEVTGWCRDTLAVGWTFREALCDVRINDGAQTHAFEMRLPVMHFVSDADLLAFRLRWL